jgi:hypothetical protein
MKSYVSKAEMEELGEGLIKHYAGSSKEPLRCVDIEGFITEYLGLTIEYVSLAESDKDKIGFVSDGRYPLKVFQDGAVIERVFPVNTIVLDRLLLRAYESGRRRFTMAHEAAHIIFERINPEPVACFHRIYDTEQTYDVAELAKRFNFEETQASAMAAVLLMPQFLVEQALRVFNGGRRLPIYGSGVLHPREKVIIQKMADSMGVSFTALVIRLRGFGMLNYHPLEEYMEKEIRQGGIRRAD